MRLTMMTALAAMLMLGCGAADPDGGLDGGGLDGGAPDATVDASCASLQAAWQAGVAAAGVACENDDDCRIVGGQGSICEGAPHISVSCGGDAVNAAAYQVAAAMLESLERAFEAAACGLDEAEVDCSSNWARCDGNVCTAVEACDCLCKSAVAVADRR